MRDLWYEAYEAAADECDGEPSTEAVQAKYEDIVGSLIDAADMERDRREGR